MISARRYVELTPGEFVGERTAVEIRDNDLFAVRSGLFG